MSNKQNISVIIPTKNRPDDLARLLASLNSQTLLPNELIIVDASDNDETANLIHSVNRANKYSVYYLKTKPSLTHQRNLGIRKSSGNCVFFFDDDIVLNSSFIEIILKTFKEFNKANVGGICGRITNVKLNNSKIDRIFKRLFFLTEPGNGRMKLSGFPAHKCDYDLAFVNVLPGGCTAFSSEVFSTYSFDENLKGYSYMEDVDFSYRVSKEFNLIYQPDAKLEHFATTYKATNSRALRRMMVRNHVYLFRKNLPKGLIHIFAFVMSLIGLLLYNAVLAKDIKACVGIAEGLITPLSLSHSVKKERDS